MISPGTFTVRCDGTDPSTGDRCKSSKVLIVPIKDLAFLRPGHAEAVTFFGAHLPADWLVLAPEQKVLCPSCKK